MANKVKKYETSKGDCLLIVNDNFEINKPVQNFLKVIANKGLSPNTVRTYAMQLKFFFDYLDFIQVPLNLVTETSISSDGMKIGPIDRLADFQSFRRNPVRFMSEWNGEHNLENVYPQDLDEKTIQLSTMVVLLFLKYCSRNKILADNMMFVSDGDTRLSHTFLSEVEHAKSNNNTSALHDIESLLMYSVPDKPQNFVNNEDFEKIFGSCQHLREKVIVSLLFHGGLRVGELLGLQFDDFSDIQDNIVHIKTRENNDNGARVKDYSDRSVYIPPEDVKLINTYLNNERSKYSAYENLFVFTNLYAARKSKPMSYQNLEKIIVRIGQRAGIKLHSHMFRHGFVTLRENSISPEKLARCVGHKWASSNEPYEHYTDSDIIKMEKNYFDKGLHKKLSSNNKDDSDEKQQL